MSGTVSTDGSASMEEVIGALGEEAIFSDPNFSGCNWGNTMYRNAA